ncbi:uncharacterized protein N7477_000232 [Penicillium maclennaniae]|uniref:uncharacterized protein n=1 Tax=Penicillium maclennaniae TaxID=1343394 RepID=UPI002541DB54|nr:uncharacterized protein N7477_000232 [Penicillium maclennaniae]KAJ5683887.1 hypothetical protein N7477_000232 [Penicillium maclennaniae]
MAPREELIASAVTFLQDPSVASSPIEKRVAFLQSKNLTQEEVDLALSRVGEDPATAAAAASAASSQSYPSQQIAYRPPQQPPQGYGYPPYNQWQPPPEPPKRDWRDWFIMATVVGGVGYGMYFVAKRYITPLIAPPTPPQLEQDKANIDEQFSRAFTLIDQLSTDTSALKAAEGDLKTSSRRRDDETRRISDEVKTLKDVIPKALEGAREGNENRLKELGGELKSLKVLLGNRLGGSGSASPSAGRTVGSSTPIPAATPRPAEETPTPSTSIATNGMQPTVTPVEQEPQPATASSAPQNNDSPLSKLGRSASIPAWQMAAANRSKSGSQSSPSPAADKPAGSEQSAPPS